MKHITSTFRLFLIPLALLTVKVSLAQNKVSNDSNLSMFTLDSGGKIWFDGESTVNIFNCVSKNIDGVAYLSAKIQNVAQTSAQHQRKQKRVLVAVPVVSFDCGKEGMNRDMYHALKEEQFRTINYEMISAEPMGSSDSASGWYNVRTRGKLTIAGRTNIVEMVIHIKEVRPGMYRVEGSKALSMVDFGIDPPSVFFGLIHVKDKLVVHFDLTASVHHPAVTDAAAYSVETQNGK
jgi:hypothetical protein